MGDNKVGDVQAVDNKYGEPTKFDPDFKGPIEKRGCTDVICCLIFTAYVVIWFMVAMSAFAQGDPDRLIFPTDTEGRICGREPLLDRKFLIFFDLTECARMGPAVVSIGCPTRQVCVEQCPTKNWVYTGQVSADMITGDIEDVAPYCVHGSTINNKEDIKKHVDLGNCPKYILSSTDYVGRCIPSLFEDAVMEIVEGADMALALDKPNGTASEEVKKGNELVSLMLNAQEIGERLLQDFKTSWWMMLIGLLIACLFAFTWIVLMRVIAAPMVWASIILMVLIFGIGTGYCVYKYMDLKDNPASSSDNLEFTTNLDAYLELRDTWLVASIVCGILLAIVLIMLIFLRSRIRLAVQLIVEGSKAVGHMMLTLIFPMSIYVLQVVVIAWWGSVALMIQATSKPMYNIQSINSTCECTSNDTTAVYRLGDDCSESSFEHHKNTTLSWFTDCCSEIECIFVKYGEETFLGFLPQWAAQLGNLFGLFWAMCFCVALGQMALAGAFASYYWAFKKPDDIPAFPLAKSVYRCFRYHLGTLAFGSLIIAICKLIIVILEYVDRKTKDNRNPIATFVIKCCKCCMWCLEKFLKFLNKNAYIYCAIYGTNFCVSAKNAFSLLMRNIVRVVVLDQITDFLLFIGKLVIVGLTAMCSFWFFSGNISYADDYVPKLNYYFMPVIVISIGAYVIASAFFNVYDMAVETMFLCFLEDCERNDGTKEKPYFMSKGLMKLVSKENKFKDD